MQHGFIEISNGRIHYSRYGNGNRLLIALHGFGDQGDHFHKLQNDAYTIYAPDLPFHGESEWLTDSYGKEDLLELIEAICTLEGKKSFVLLGHSLGGRIALALLDEVGKKLSALFLLAPDGVKTRWMHLPDLAPRLLRTFAKKLLRNSRWLLKTSRVLRRARLLDPFIDSYLHFHFHTEKRKKRLLDTWVSTAGFRFRAGAVRNKLINLNIPVRVIAGKKDKLISIAALQKLARGIPGAELFILEKGHRLIDEETALLLFSTT
jgi:pimeloyl-ACP methyl ester carboxylesterase